MDLGAARESAVITELSDSPLSYVETPTIQIRVRALGTLAEFFRADRNVAFVCENVTVEHIAGKADNSVAPTRQDPNAEIVPESKASLPSTKGDAKMHFDDKGFWNLTAVSLVCFQPFVLLFALTKTTPGRH